VPQATLSRRLVAEALGTAMLVAAVVGSGIMATSLTKDAGLALLANSLATGAALVVLIATLGPLSGAHFNPVVSLALWLRGSMPLGELGPYVSAQFAGGILGTLAAHAMFEMPLADPSLTARTGVGQWLSEAVAAFGLVATILAGLRYRADAMPWLVGLYITSAYWFTASTSFANPAVTVARAFTDTFAGIRPIDAPIFIVAQVAGALAAIFLIGWLLDDAER